MKDEGDHSWLVAVALPAGNLLPEYVTLPGISLSVGRF